jgi:hypothetical protein
MRRWLELAGALSFLVVGGLAGLWGLLLLGGEETAPQVGAWVLLGSVPIVVLGVLLLLDWRRAPRPGREGDS